MEHVLTMKWPVCRLRSSGCLIVEKYTSTTGSAHADNRTLRALPCITAVAEGFLP